MSRGFTEGTEQRVHDIKNQNGIRRQGEPADWVCQDLVNMGDHKGNCDVAGSEAKPQKDAQW